VSSNLDELPGQLVELRDLIRQAHEATADLRAVLRQAKAMRDSLPAAAEKAVTEKFAAEVETGLESFGKALDKAVEDGTQAVFRRFDRIEQLLLGEDRRSVRAGKPSIPQMIETIAAIEGNVPAALRRSRSKS
jgi:DNA-binding FrmR family transcriptional regulator